MPETSADYQPPEIPTSGEQTPVVAQQIPRPESVGVLPKTDTSPVMESPNHVEEVTPGEKIGNLDESEHPHDSDEHFGQIISATPETKTTLENISQLTPEPTASEAVTSETNLNDTENSESGAQQNVLGSEPISLQKYAEEKYGKDLSTDSKSPESNNVGEKTPISLIEYAKQKREKLAHQIKELQNEDDKLKRIVEADPELVDAILAQKQEAEEHDSEKKAA